MDVEIRRGTPDEAATLTAIAHDAKRHWRYPEEWIERWKVDLTITPDFIANNEVFVAIVSNEIAGCCALVEIAPQASPNPATVLLRKKSRREVTRDTALIFCQSYPYSSTGGSNGTAWNFLKKPRRSNAELTGDSSKGIISPS